MTTWVSMRQCVMNIRETTATQWLWVVGNAWRSAVTKVKRRTIWIWINLVQEERTEELKVEYSNVTALDPYSHEILRLKVAWRVSNMRVQYSNVTVTGLSTFTRWKWDLHRRHLTVLQHICLFSPYLSVYTFSNAGLTTHTSSSAGIAMLFSCCSSKSIT